MNDTVLNNNKSNHLKLAISNLPAARKLTIQRSKDHYYLAETSGTLGRYLRSCDELESDKILEAIEENPVLIT